MSSYIAFINTQTGEFNSEKVQENVARYIKQLETYVKYPRESKLLDVHTHLRPSVISMEIE